MTTYAVTTEFGTFTRKTTRTYTHIVVGVFDNGNTSVNWCGRADLAQKAYAENVSYKCFVTVAIVDVTTGDTVAVKGAVVAV